MHYKINTYGCQMNVHESERIAHSLEKLGYTETKEDNFDIIVFNTCCIRDTAEQKILGHIGKLKKIKRANPKLIIAIVGCMSSQKGKAEELRSKYPYIDIILGANNLEDLENAILNLQNNHKKTFLTPDDDKPQVIEDVEYTRTSMPNAWVNIMYGCNNFCTYCIVPYVRGRERSRKPESIIAECTELINQGYKEITLLGQNVNSYGNDFEDKRIDFAGLLERLAQIPGDHRIRFMTSHPKDLNEKVIDIIAKYDTLCKNIHLPIQSGSNNILTAMNRHYTRDKYLEIVKKIREKMPLCGITTDIMVGFPGESEWDFEDTLDIVKQVKFSGAFTYIYSPRKGTPASVMEQIPYEIKSQRIQKLIKTQNQITKELSKNYEGKIYRVLVEDAKDDGKLCGRTDCGRLVTFSGDKSLIGSFKNILITKSQSASLFGEITEEK